MKCELKIITRDIKEAIINLPTRKGMAQFIRITSLEAIIIVPIFMLAGINAVIAAVVLFVSACIAIVYFNARDECKTMRAEANQ